jgi:hypothetical protein
LPAGGSDAWVAALRPWQGIGDTPDIIRGMPCGRQV